MNTRARRKGRRRFGAVVQEANGLFTARWRENGERRGKRGFTTRKEADDFLAVVRTRVAARVTDTDLPMTFPAITVNRAIDAYEEHRREKGNKPGTLAETSYRLRAFFTDPEILLSDLTPANCGAYYESLRTRPNRLGRQYAVDTHRNVLAEAKSLLKWCCIQRWIAKNPLAAQEGKGRRRHGKPQLRIDEARAWLSHATELAESGEAGAVAAMMTLLLGVRAGEIVSRVVRDLDDDGRLIWIPDAKTDAGRRTLRVPETLRSYLLQLAEGKGRTDLLFGNHWRDWPREWVQKICTAAKVPKVSAHSMRGLHSTLAFEAGITGAVVAASLGHESVTTTKQSYANPQAVAAAQQERTLSVLKGGLSA